MIELTGKGNGGSLGTFPVVYTMKWIYFDNSATTPLSEGVKKKIGECLELYGNPSSLHPVGQGARTALEEARRQVGLSLGLRSPAPGQIIFTASGTESDNLAVLGTAYAKPRRRGGRIISTDSEHSGVEKALCALETDGFDVVRIPTRGGVLDMDAYRAALNDRVFLVTMMAVNNETGAAYDIKTAFGLAKAKNRDIVTHTDAVQAFLKIPLNPVAIGADLVTVSGHKIHAPKGVGALYVSSEALKRRDLVPILRGGGQEAGFRSGTENLLGIIAMGEAAREGREALAQSSSHMAALRNMTEVGLEKLGMQINRPKGGRAPHIVNLTLPDIKSETMLHALSKSGICISQGSACSAHAKSVSSALLAFGLKESEAECSVRVSFGRENTREEVELFLSALEEQMGCLVRIHR